MSKEALTYDDLLQIVQLIKSAESFAEFHVKIGDIEIDLRKTGATSVPAAADGDTPPALAVADARPVSSPAQPPAAATPAAAPSAKTASAPRGKSTGEPAYAANAVLIKSPMVGTFYRAPEPGAKPFVSVGDHVTPDTTVCIIEVMKLMNSIPAGCHGTVTHVQVDDAEPVDVGQVLIAIVPEG